MPAYFDFTKRISVRVERQASLINKPPVWFTKGFQAELDAQKSIKHRTQLLRGERKILNKRKPILPSQWAERHRYVSQKISDLAGRWKNENTPYLTAMLDALALPYVRQLIACKGPQIGVTELALNFVCYALDRDPGPVLFVLGSENAANHIAVERLAPVLRSSKRMRSYLTGNEDDISKEVIRLQHALVYFSWSTSSDRLATRPARYVIFDELDKYPPSPNKIEGDPVRLGEARANHYESTYKFLKISTPTVEDKYIWQAFTNETQAVFDYWVQCPFCKTKLLMDFDRFWWPKQETALDIFSKKLARYECQHCQEKWNDEHRNQAARAGEWRERETETEIFEFLDINRPASIGFHLPGWISRFVSLSKCVRMHLDGLKDREALKHFRNQIQALPWKDFEQTRTEDKIYALCYSNPPGRVFTGNGVKIACLTAGIDTQASGFPYEIRAWAYGEYLTSWQVYSGTAESLRALEILLFHNVYQDQDGNGYKVRYAFIDSGGGKDKLAHFSRTHEVYAWARQNAARGVLAVKGESGRRAQPYRTSRIDRFPDTGAAIPGGLKLLLLDVNYYKDQLAAKLEIEKGKPGSFNYSSRVNEAWARQMVAEYKDEETTLWTCPKHRDNHAWDCSVYGLACAEIVGVRFFPTPEESAEQYRQTEDQQNKDDDEDPTYRSDEQWTPW